LETAKANGFKRKRVPLL